MGKWDKLNKEFDEFLDNFSQEDWKNWDNSRKHLKKKRQSELLIQALVCEQRFALSEAELVPPETYEFDKICEIQKSPINSGIFFINLTYGKFLQQY